MTDIFTEYIMTMHAASAGAAQAVDNSLTIYHIGPGSWARGPHIDGEVAEPAADWLRVMPSGAFRIDARVTVKTVDDALIYISYNGIMAPTAGIFERLQRGETLTSDDVYFVIAPTFETSHEKYAWLNHVQAVGKLNELKLGSHVRYDIFAVR